MFMHVSRYHKHFRAVIEKTVSMKLFVEQDFSTSRGTAIKALVTAELTVAVFDADCVVVCIVMALTRRFLVMSCIYPATSGTAARICLIGNPNVVSIIFSPIVEASII